MMPLNPPPAPQAGWRQSLVPVLITALLAFTIPTAASALAVLLSKFAGTPSASGALLPFLYVHHALQGCSAGLRSL